MNPVKSALFNREIIHERPVPRIIKTPIVLLIFLTLLSSGCQNESTKKTIRPPDVTIAEPIRKEVTKYLEYTGNTATLESVDIRARVPGFLTRVCFEPRAKVKVGDLLFVIDPRQYEASVKEGKAKLEAQKASSKLTQTELQISQQLESKEAISALKLEKKTAERDVTRADVELAGAALDKAKLDLEWTQVTSPINGRVSRNLVDVGNLVGATEKTLLTTVVDDDSVYVYFNISERDLLSVRRKANKTPDPVTQLPPDLPVYISLVDESDYPHVGRIDFAETTVDQSTGTIQVRGIFPNPDGLLMGGMFVRVRVPLENREALLVPDVALQFDQGGKYVFTVDEQQVVQQRRVKIGERVDRMRVIEEGLKITDNVIVDGIQRARPGSKVNPVKPTVARNPQPETQPASKKD